MPYVTASYERTKLYEEVWADPVTKVAKSYGISDVALNKICKKLAVPTPPPGYWARVVAGKKIPRPLLPAFSGATEISRQRLVNAEPTEPDPEYLVAQRLFEAKDENRVVVSSTLEMPHPLVAASERALRKPKQRDTRNLPNAEQRCLDIAVSEGSLPRALRIMDALAKALEARRMPLRIESEGKRQTCVTIDGQNLAIRIVENTLRSERQPTVTERKDYEKYGHVYLPNRYVFEPTGQLRLGILSGHYSELKRSVSDGKHQRVEKCINAFIVKLVEEAVTRKRETEERERWHREWEEQERRREEREKQVREEAERFKALEEETRNWRRAEEIRDYVATVEAKSIGENDAIDPAGELGQWIKWARDKADWLDPLVEAKCPILDADEGENEEDDD